MPSIARPPPEAGAAGGRVTVVGSGATLGAGPASKGEGAPIGEAGAIEGASGAGAALGTPYGAGAPALGPPNGEGAPGGAAEGTPAAVPSAGFARTPGDEG